MKQGKVMMMRDLLKHIPAWSTIKAGVIGVKGYLIGAAVASALCLPLGYCTGLDHGKDAERAAQAKAERELRDLNNQSAGMAAGERGGDDAAADEDERKRNNAIGDAEGGAAAPSDASNALNCERLRRQGANLANFPACGRYAGGS